jgi:CBS domain-containing protein
MSTTSKSDPQAVVRTPLGELTAADLMTPNPVSLRDTAPFEEAVAFLTDQGYSAAPVIDAAGRPVGVISRTDIVVYERRRIAAAPSAFDCYERAELADAPELPEQETATVRDLMTAALFSAAPETPAANVAEQMVAMNVHRLFVVDHDGVLVGVISALDLLRHVHGRN